MSRNVSGPQSGSSTGDPDPRRPVPAELPVLDHGVIHERSDAARNRLRVLAAAEALFAERGVPSVTMDDIAAAAGVGKGTLYRRFGDKGGLAMALLDHQERDLQQLILSGLPPVGPGACPADRLAAFAEAYLGFLDRAMDLVLLSETSTAGARFRTGAHAFWATHCRLLLQEAGAPHPGLAADLLLAGLSAEQVAHWLRDKALPLAEVSAAMTNLARTLAGSWTGAAGHSGHKGGGGRGTD